TTCAHGVGSYCLEDGSGEETFACDPLQGLTCLPEGCQGACTPQHLGNNHVGCDFWPTVTANSVWSQWFPFGVMVVNTTKEPATVVVTRGETEVLTTHIEPAGMDVIELPWIEALKGADADNDGSVFAPKKSVLSKVSGGGGAYRLRSNQPVVVTQFSTPTASNPQGVYSGCPLNADSGECLSYSNDASLLMPGAALGSTYSLMGWHAWKKDASQSNSRDIGDFVSITATQDNTTVTLKPVGTTLPLEGVSINAGEETDFYLGQGDVLQLFTDPAMPSAQWAGSTVTSNHPIQVLTGAPCVNVPDRIVTCDHIEESNLPVEMLGNHYLVTAPLGPNGKSRHILRIHGIKDETLVEFDPSSVHSAITVNQGEVVELDLQAEGEETHDYVVSSNRVFGVTQYMVGHRAEPYSPDLPNADYGDPSQTLVIPTSRYLKRYMFALPPGFEHHRVDVIAATGAEVMLDEQVVDPSSFTAIGASGLSVARLENPEPGVRHELRSEKAFGLQVSGFGKFTSYSVPGGIDLRPSNQ
ncbi:MAG: hypothetical protein CSA75_04290, partial [Sorangium cellulosum]